MIRRLIPSCKHSRGQGLQSLTLQWSANRFWLPCFFAVTISIRISSWTHLRIPPLNRQTYICCDYNLSKPLAASSRFPFWDLASHGAFIPWCRADRILSDFTPSKTKHNSLDLLSFGVSGFCRPVLTHFLFQGFYPLRVLLLQKLAFPITRRASPYGICALVVTSSSIPRYPGLFFSPQSCLPVTG